jgi:hypothetical protein
LNELERLFTYDIVADPGFASTNLYESRQEIKKENRLKNIKLLKRRLKIAKLCNK